MEIIIGVILGLGFFYFVLIYPRAYEARKNYINRMRVVKDQYDEGYSFVELYVYQTNHIRYLEKNQKHNYDLQRGLFGGIRFLKKENEYYFSLLKMNNNLDIDGYKIFNINDVASCKVDSQMSVYTTSSLGKEIVYGDSTDVKSRTDFKVIFLFKDLSQKPLEFYGIQEECIYIERLFNSIDNLKIELSKRKVLTFEEIINSLSDKLKKIAVEEEILKETK